MKNSFRVVATLFIGFTIGIHIAVMLHEFGHALGQRLSGRPVDAIQMLSPLPAGQVLPRSDAVANIWGGVAFGTLTSIAIWAMAAQLSHRPSLSFVLRMAAALGFAHNGVYLFVGGFLPYGDASWMVSLGTPRWFLIAVGLPVLAATVFPLAAAVRKVGISPAEPLWKWLVVVQAGLLPIPALMALSTFVPSSGGYSMRYSMLGLLICFAICFSVATILARRSAEAGDEAANRLPATWTTTLRLFSSAVVLIALEWLAFHPR